MSEAAGPPRPDSVDVDRDTRSRRVPNTRGPRLRSTPVSQLAAKSILDWIVDENLEPGKMLPNEASMASGLQVARATLREALQLLTSHGIIEVRTGRGGGPVIQEPSAAAFAQQSLMLLQFMRVSYQDLLECRQILEPTITQAAARYGDDPQLAELQDSAALLGDTVDDLTKYNSALTRFHLILGDCTGNSVVSVINSVFLQASRSVHENIPVPLRHRKGTIGWYARITEAIVAGDDEGARSTTENYLAHYRRWLDRYSPASLRQTVRWVPGR